MVSKLNIAYILLEYHSGKLKYPVQYTWDSRTDSYMTDLELAEDTEVSLYTTSVDGTRHVWTAGETFGHYANKQYFLPDDESFVCCLNVTFQRHQDKPTQQGIFKRP